MTHPSKMPAIYHYLGNTTTPQKIPPIFTTTHHIFYNQNFHPPPPFTSREKLPERKTKFFKTTNTNQNSRALFGAAGFGRVFTFKFCLSCENLRYLFFIPSLTFFLAFNLLRSVRSFAVVLVCVVLCVIALHV